MKVAVDQLKQQLKRQTPSVLLINGNETLLIEEALDVIRAHYRQQGVVERLSYAVDAKFDWESLAQSGGNLSLFSESRLLEMRMPTAKPGTKGAKFFTTFVDDIANQATQDILLVVTDYLTKQQRNAKWIKAIEKEGLIVDCYEVKAQQLPQWIKQRLQGKALRVEAGVVEALAKSTEGNLLATSQIIDQLDVLAVDGAVTNELLHQTMEDQSRFSVYSLVDSCLLGVPDECVHRLARIKAEADNAVLLVWSLVRETRELLKMSEQLHSGQNINSVFQENRVWSNRQRFVGSALNRLNQEKLLTILTHLLTIDAIAKGQHYGDIWHEIEKLCLRYCGLDTHSTLLNNKIYDS